MAKSLNWLDRRVRQVHPAAGWIGGISAENPATQWFEIKDPTATHGGIGTNGVTKGIPTTTIG